MYSKTFVIQVYNKKQFAAMAEKKILGSFPTVKIKVLSTYPNIFWEPDVATSSSACEELIPCCWLLVGMFQHKEPPNQRKPND